MDYGELKRRASQAEKQLVCQSWLITHLSIGVEAFALAVRLSRPSLLLPTNTHAQLGSRYGREDSIVTHEAAYW